MYRRTENTGLLINSLTKDVEGAQRRTEPMKNNREVWKKKYCMGLKKHDQEINFGDRERNLSAWGKP